MDKKSLTVFINARTGSRRCKNKMLRPFAGTTLIDIALCKLREISSEFDTIFASHEDELIVKAKKYGIRVFERSHESTIAEDDHQAVFEVLGFLESDFVAFVNPCCPFFSVESIRKVLRKFQESGGLSMTCVCKDREWLFYKDSTPVLDITTISTKTCDYVFRVSHNMHIYPRKRFFHTGVLWDNKQNIDPMLFEVSRGESLDIDFEDQFYSCEHLYKQGTNENSMFDSY